MTSLGTRPWTRFYAPATAQDLPPLGWPTVAALVRESAATYAAQEAFTLLLPNGTRGALTFAEVDRLSDAFAAYLREVAGLGPGDRLAVQMPNCLAYPIVVFGALKAGIVMVNTNPLYTAPEMEHQFIDSGATGLVVVDLFADKVAKVLPKTSIRTVVLVTIADLLPWLPRTMVRAVQRYVKKQVPAAAFAYTTFDRAIAQGTAKLKSGADPHQYLQGAGHDRVATLQYTGGTTGVSKGAVLTEGNLLANIIQCIEVWKPGVIAGKETVVTALPLYHIFAFTANLMVFFVFGGRNILLPSPRPLSNLKRALTAEGATWLTGVNTLFAGLMHEPWFQQHTGFTLKGTVAGGMALVPAVGERWEAVTKTPIYQGYGLTETSPVVSLVPFHRNKRESIGVPVPGTDVRIVDAEGREVGPGEAGELLVRGPQVMTGYWQRLDETARVLKDGWLATGDVATADDDGYLYIVDRKKDMILVSGFNVYPNEVEAVLAAHPGIAEVAVVGTPDETSGEAVCAFVVRRDPALTEAAVRAHCRESLTAYKVPRIVRFRDDLPKSPVGKVLRKDLRELALPG
ncbi:MAG TPA: AMP-binding protein [Vicinamibacterales bacterium]|nr:AMP-binding protein [Vicinamibacterales bacterium]